MVFYFTSSQGHVVYMGKDKFENEDLLKYGWPEDVWFHVDDLSSAHVYLRLKADETFLTIPKDIINECCQLVKEHSIEGKKLDSCKVVYTEYGNLLKTPDMAVGAVSFHDEKKRILVDVVKDKEIIKKIMKTKEERNNVNLEKEKELRMEAEKKEKIAFYKQQEKLKLAEEKKKKQEEDAKIEKQKQLNKLMISNKENPKNLEDDFM